MPPSAPLPVIDAPLPYVALLEQRAPERIDLAVVHCTELPDLATAREYGERVLYPSGTGNRRKPGTGTLFAHTGGDVGASNSWRAGASMVWAKAYDRPFEDIDSAGNPVNNVFTGNSRLAILDGVWKWSPNGNATRTSLTLQGEYFRRIESGSLVYDESGQALALMRAIKTGFDPDGILNPGKLLPP